RCTLWTDLMLLRKLWQVRSGVLIGTRPCLNLLALTVKRPELVVIGTEHMHYGSHPATLQSEIRRRYRGLDAFVVLTDHDLRQYREVLPRDARPVRIPNAVPGSEQLRPTGSGRMV